MSSSQNPSRSPSGPSNAQPMSNDFRSTFFAMMEAGISPKVLLGHFAPSFTPPQDADDLTLWGLLASMIEPPKRKKLLNCNTIVDAISLISKAQKIMVLSGAGISTSAGIPDFRSRNGIYVQIHAEHGDLEDPKLMFDIEYFRRNPKPFYQFAEALYPGQYKPTIGHKFIKCIEDHNKLLRNYSQNIDTLEKQASIKRVIECHGSFSKASCTSCQYSVDGDAIKVDILEQRIPLCPKCHVSGGPSDGLGVMKPNIVFFGEQLDDEFHRSLQLDKEEVDLLIVIGSSLKVRPVALIPKSIPNDVPQILINKEPLDHMRFDIELLGDCDEIIQELCLRLGNEWVNICEPGKTRLSEIAEISAVKVVMEDDTPPASRSVCKTDKCTDEHATEVEKLTCLKENSKKKTDSNSNDNFGKVPHGNELNMIEEEGGIECKGDESRALDGNSEISDYGDSSDEDWEDIQILSGSPQSPGEIEDLRAKVIIELPKTSYFFLRPNRYIFQGAELTKAQFEKFTKESQISPDDQTKPPHSELD